MMERSFIFVLVLFQYLLCLTYRIASRGRFESIVFVVVLRILCQLNSELLIDKLWCCTVTLYYNSFLSGQLIILLWEDGILHNEIRISNSCEKVHLFDKSFCELFGLYIVLWQPLVDHDVVLGIRRRSGHDAIIAKASFHIEL